MKQNFILAILAIAFYFAVADVYESVVNLPYPVAGSDSYSPDEYVPYQFHDNNKGTGPISPDVLGNHPRLDYLGTTNGKSYYIENTQLNWGAAQEFCQNLGMELAIFDNQAAQTYIHARIPSTYLHVWTGGHLRSSPQITSFMWMGPNTTVYSVPNWRVYSDSYQTLILWVNPDNGYPNNLVISPQARLSRPLCYV